MMSLQLTDTSIDMVQVARAIFVRSITGFAVKSRLTRTATTRILYNHRLIQVLIELERRFALLHELCWFWEVILFALPRPLS